MIRMLLDNNYIHQYIIIYLYLFFNPYNFKMKSNFDLRVSMLKRSGVQQNLTTGRSFISTPLVNDSLSYGDDLRKSRIQNLPNYKKTNLGENVNFIVVFQTIEIQRLANEIELLRVKVKQFERQLFNAQNYQVQIRELTEKCFTQENQLEEFRDQYQKLNKICQTLYHQNQSLKTKLSEMDFSLKQKYQSQKQKNSELMQEIQKWKNRYQASQKSKSKQLEQLRNLMESQRKSMIDRQIREMTIRFQNQRSSLQNQIRKCRQILNNRNSEIQNYKQKCQKYEIAIMQSRNYENVINQHQNKIALISNELMRLSQLLRNKEDQIQNYKKRQYQLNIKLKEQKQWENDNKNLRAAIQAKIKEIEEWRIRASRLQQQSVRGKELIHYNNQLSDKLDLASRELQRLNNLLKVKLEQIQKWKQRYTAKESELSKYNNLENDMAQYEAKINMIRAENDRINGILKARLQEIQVWKKKNADLQGGLSRMSFIQQDKKILEDKFNNQIKNNQQLKFVISKLEGENKEFRKYQTRCRQIQMKNEAICNEMQRLNILIKNKDQQLNDNRIKFNRFESAISQYKNVQIHLKDYQNKIALMSQQIDRLNNLIKNKNQDIQNLEQEQLKLHSAVNKYKTYQHKINQNQQVLAKLQNNIEIHKKDIENWQNKFRTSQTKAKELQNNLYSNSQQKQKIGSIARAKSQQCQQLKNKIVFMQNELKKNGQLQSLCEQLHKKSMIYLNDLQIMERRAKQNENLLNKEKNNVQQYKNKLNSTSVQYERLMKESKNNEGKKSKQFMQLQEHYSKLLSKVKSKDDQIEKLVSKISQLESQCGNLMKQFNRLLDAVQKSFEESLGLGRKIQQYQDYAKRIHILGSELDRLNKQNKHLQEDNKTMRLKYANNINSEKREQQFGLITVLMSAQIESLRNRIEQREMSIDQMRKSILEPVRRI